MEQRVIISKNLKEELAAAISECEHDKIFVLTDETTEELCWPVINKFFSLKKAKLITIPASDNHKTIESVMSVWEALGQQGATRHSCMINLGGGMVTDLGGFAASTFKRGIDFINIPTTLLAMVDASVGGKTAVDLPNGKNMAGAFYQPSLVICDPETLTTLPETEYRNGCAEIIKYAMLSGNEELFSMLAGRPVRERYEEIIGRCVSIKRDFVEADEFDRGQRMLLNFGHTVGHAIEACSRFSIPHGQAVAMGMAAIVRGAAAKGACTKETAEALVSLIAAYGLATELPFPKAELSAAAASDKKNTTDAMRIVVPDRIGTCHVQKIPQTEFPEWF